ncbi:MAG: hypothetical protein QNL62_15915 [Gammaproteobacteria bacterium]|nr:hypothetical protein [Gammaproteobacteria bacterium]
MKHFKDERRKSEMHQAFPFIDSEGNEVKYDRRRGNSRRRNKQDSDIADKILNIIN